MALEERSFRLGLRVDLSGFGLVVQATLSDGISFDPFAFNQDGLAAPEVDVSRDEIVVALVVSAVIVVLHFVSAIPAVNLVIVDRMGASP